MRKNTETRTLQYASFSFDASVGDLFGTFYAGGCVCVPSEHERLNDLPGTINRMRCTHLCVTATTLATLSPNKVSSLYQLTVGGEAITREQIRQWASCVCLSTVYGTTESAVWDTYRHIVAADDSPMNIGHSMGPSTWIVDSANTLKLMPIGAIGELLIGGSLLARGYLNDPVRTAAAFIKEVPWLQSFQANRNERLYCTGDLARYNPDGTIEFFGRKDQQIKISGQRVELGDIDHALRQCLPVGISCVADIIRSNSQDRQSILAAFLSGPDHTIQRVSSRALRKELRRLLPEYMIPLVFVPLANGLPTTPSGKLDRPRLREWGESALLESKLGNDKAHVSNGEPVTTIESKLQVLWAKVLGLEDPNHISLDCNFFEVGGSSISAIHLVALAREQDLHFTVGDVFEQGRLSSLATVAKTGHLQCDDRHSRPLAPFSLLNTPVADEMICNTVAAMCGVRQDQIQDIFPCTPLQEGLLALTAKRSGEYLAQVKLGLPSAIDLDRFKAAYEEVAVKTPILRTRFVSLKTLGTQICQVVLNEDVKWFHSLDLEQCQAKNQEELACRLGESMVRCCIVEDDSNGKRHFLWAIHHALFDEWSLQLILDAIERQYLGQVNAALLPFQHFIHYLKTTANQAACEDYWRSELDGAACLDFPPSLSSSSGSSTSSSQIIRHTANRFKWPSNATTRSILARAAWTLLLSRLSGSSDVVFGATVIGRQASMPLVERVAGPTIATVPIRVQLEGIRHRPLSELLRRLHRQASAMVPFEQMGLQEIGRLSSDAEQACKFQTLLVVQQPEMETDNMRLLDRGDEDEWGNFNSYAITLQIWTYESELRFQLDFDDTVLEVGQAERLLLQLEDVIRQLCTASPEDLLLSDIDSCTSCDVKDLMAWNKKPPSPDYDCVTQTIARRAREQPDAPAIEAWDGSVSYREFDLYATRLAGRLVSDHGLERGRRVLVCSEKSIWCVVGILAILKAGGVCVPIDSSTSRERIQTIVNTSQVVLALVSSTQLHRLQDRIRTVILDRKLLEDSDSSKQSMELDACNLTEDACIIFTSGTTGVPKAIRWTHLVLATTAHELGSHFHLTSDIKVFQFSSYAFDVSIHEMLATLAHGGCLFVPSEKARSDELEEAIRISESNFLIITPSVGKILNPANLLFLQTVIFCGEPLSSDLAKMWARRMRVVNWYGPAECSLATFCDQIGDSWEEGNIGKGLSTVTWIVDPRDHENLLPIGAVGELLLEGPCLTTGYINDDTQSSGSFISGPGWWHQFQSSSTESRLYKTGDFVSYANDGSLVFIGRKDTLVKVRGQRVELGKIEYRIRQILGSDEIVVVEVVTLKGDSMSILCAFISAPNQDKDICHVPQATISMFQHQLEDILPSYMMPASFLTLKQLPRTATDKVDRKQLQCLGSALLTASRNETPSVTASKEKPFTILQKALQKLWVDTLGLSREDIGLDDHFIGLGGNSIDAMRLVALAKIDGYSLSVEDVMMCPQFSDQVRKLHKYEPAYEDSVPRFSLIGGDSDVSKMRIRAAAQCGVQPEQIEDIFPCTPMQTALLALTSKRVGDYVSQDVYRITCDVDTFQRAWQTVIAATPILRTRIVDLAGLGLCQSVVDEAIEWEDVDWCLEKYLKYNQGREMGLGTRLARWAIVHDSFSASGLSFVWTTHHSLYDGWSLRLILDQLGLAYTGKALMRITPFQHFIRYINEHAFGAAADNFWKNQLSSAVAPAFPALPSPEYQPLAKAQAERCVVSIKMQNQSKVTFSIMIRAAWSILLAHWTGTDDVVFSAVVIGRQVPIRDVDLIAAPTIATVPIRVRVGEQGTIQNLLQTLQRQALEMIPFEQAGLQRIRSLNEETRRACSFQTMIVIQPATGDRDFSLAEQSGLFEHRVADRASGVFYSDALILHCTFQKDRVVFNMKFDEMLVDPVQADRMLCQLENILVQMCDMPPSTRLVDLQLASPSDVQEIWNWNLNVPEAVDSTIDTIFNKTVQRYPDELAVCAWDARLTYNDVEQYSSRLAKRLLSQGLQTQDLVPICFEKSAWTVVAIMGIIKAGGTVVMLDVSQPESRQQSIVKQLNASIIVASWENHDLSQRLLPDKTVITVDERIRDADQDLDLQHEEQQIRTLKNRPSDSLYVVFTSGSTGTPKGAIITHSNFCTFMRHKGSLQSYGPKERVLDIISYAFDYSWDNLLCTLCAGACLCIPADTKDIAAEIEKFQPTVMNCISSIARLLDPKKLPSLRTLVLGGEAAGMKELAKWENKVDVVNAYGPAECTPYVSYSHLKESESVHVGRGTGATMWVIDLANSNRLACIGGFGELWLEGPQIGRGYLNDPDKTSASFVENPPWLQGNPDGIGRKGRLYRTGDLVQYNPDGTLKIIGRIDSQTKLRGQRLELEEVEYYVRRCLAGGFDVVAEVITLSSSQAQLLVVFVVHTISNDEKGSTLASRRLKHDVGPKVAEFLPSFMCPSAYITLAELPRLPAGKVDRKKLRAIGSAMPPSEFTDRDQNTDRSPKRTPTTANEKVMQHLWASTLGLDPHCLGAEDSFLQVDGGDSLSAMRLVSLARESGISMTVADVFLYPKLCELAREVIFNVCEEDAIPPFSLCPGNCSISFLKKEAAARCNVAMDQIQDVLPCTSLQEGLLALTAQSPTSYTATEVFALNPHVTFDRLHKAWEAVVADTAILRTRIVDLPYVGLCQIVIDAAISFISSDSIKATTENQRIRMGLGTELSQYALISGSNGQRSLVWTIHHALYDGWSMPLILQQVERAYHHQRLRPLRSMQPLIHFLNTVDEAASRDFWISQLNECAAPSFPLLPSTLHKPRATASVEITISNLDWPRRNDVTPSTWIRAALAILLGRIDGSNDVTFGAIVSGRQAPVAGIEHIVGLTIATVPIRVVLDWSQSVGDFMRQLHQQAIRMIQFEQIGLQRLQRINNDTKRACQFQTLLNVQQFTSTATSRLWTKQSTAAGRFDNYALILDVELHRASTVIRAEFDETVMPGKRVQRIVGQLETILHQFCQNDLDLSIPLGNLASISPSDLEEVWKWNAVVPDEVLMCFQEITRLHIDSRPDAPAVDAWDGRLTYKQLDLHSSRLAFYLHHELEVKPGVLVPLCFEKSMWTVVALFAVIKAGGAFTLMDVSYPKERLRAITRQVNTRLILSSTACISLATQLAERVVAVGWDTFLRLEASQPLARGCPRDRLYIVFTSGTTGTPKGAIVTHANFCSAIKHQAETLHYSQDTRVFEFASYAFDVAVSNILHCLGAGGCVCIPSEVERKHDLSETMERMRVNLVDLTPSVARTIEPRSVPHLKTLVLGGEAATRADIARWVPYVHVLNGMGTAECTVTTTMALMDSKLSTTPGIGKGLGANTWVVDSEDHQRLVGIGAVGELLVEGPLVGEGYLGNEDRTSAAFINDPCWLARGPPSDHLPGRLGRLYKTGDLVRYDTDGSLLFMGRKDAQIKIRGQRIELEEVEYHVVRLLQARDLVVDLAAEVISPQGASSSLLVVFLCPPKANGYGKDDGDEVCAMDSRFLPNGIRGLNDQLIIELPPVMVPFAYVPLNRMPLGPTGKTDRKKLKSIGLSFAIDQLANSDLTSLEPRRPPSTALERQMQRLWAEVLGLSADEIAANDDFLRLGGDSISAMRLAGRAQECGILITAMDVLSQPRLCDLAKKAKFSKNGNQSRAIEVAPYSLLQTTDVAEFLRSHVQPFISGPIGTVQDVFPVAGFQDEFIRGALQTPPVFWNYFFIDFDLHIDVAHLKRSCQVLTQHLPILRTVFIPHGTTFLQVVLDNMEPDIQELHCTDDDIQTASESLCRQDRQMADNHLGRQFTCFMLLSSAKQQKVRLIIRMSHAQYDGISLGPIMETLAAAYQGLSLQRFDSFALFVKYAVASRDLGLRYWQSILSNSFMTRLHEPQAGLGPSGTTNKPYELRGIVELVKCLPAGVTTATALTACWATVVASYTRKTDVVFGRLVSGRGGSSAPYIASFVGPCMNVVPLRVHYSENDLSLLCPSKVFGIIQQQQIEAMPFETTQLSDIVQHCTDWPAGTEFGSIFQVQNIDETPHAIFGGSTTLMDIIRPDFCPRQLWLLVKPHGQNINVQLNGSTAIMELEVARMLFDRFCTYVTGVKDSSLQLTLQGETSSQN